MSLSRWAERDGRAPAIVTAARTWTVDEVRDAIEARVRAWSGAPFVAIRGAASVAHLLDVLAAIDSGTPALMLHARWTATETDAIVARARPALLVDGGRVVRTASADAAPRGTLAVLATSGTTGTAKLAVLSRRAFVASAHASAAHLGRAAGDRWLLAMPLAHVGGLGVVVRSLVQETPIVLHEGAADPAEWLPLARAAAVTHVSLVPTTLARLLDRGETMPASVRVALLGGAACPARLLDRALAAGMPIHPTYGLTETCGQVATAKDDPRTLEPLPGVVLRVVDGTLRVRTRAMMDGWLDARSPFDADGFYDTGDLATLDDRGRPTLLARRTDLVVSGGENVYPREVEDALERIEGVVAACVFGVPDEIWGQRVAAAIVADTRAPNDDEIVRRARSELAGFKVPRLLARIDALATSGNGKVDRALTASRSTSLLRSV